MTTDYTNRIRLIGFQEIDFKVKNNIEITQDMLPEMSTYIQPMLRYRTNSDLVGVQIGIAYEYEKQKLLTYGMILTFQIKGWEDIAKKIKAKERPDRLAMQLFEIALGFVRGAMAIHARNTSFEKTFLPIINLKEMMNSVQWEDETKA